jgi:hypothetical protein
MPHNNLWGFFIAMIYYKNQDKLVALAKKTGLSLTQNRLSDLMSALYGHRGNAYDELQYWRNQNTDATGTNDKDSDAETKFATGKGVVGSRADQLDRDLWHKNSL